MIHDDQDAQAGAAGMPVFRCGKDLSVKSYCESQFMMSSIQLLYTEGGGGSCCCRGTQWLKTCIEAAADEYHNGS